MSAEVILGVDSVNGSKASTEQPLVVAAGWSMSVMVPSEVPYCRERAPNPVSQYPVADFAPQSVWIIPVESRHQIVLLTFVFHARQISELRLQAPEH